MLIKKVIWILNKECRNQIYCWEKIAENNETNLLINSKKIKKCENLNEFNFY